MLRLILFASLFVSSLASAWEFRPAVLDRMNLDVSRFTCNRELLTPEIPCDQYLGRVRVGFDLALLNDLVYWRNSVHSEGTSNKFETVGWQYEFAIPLPGNLELFMAHHSRHNMDQETPQPDAEVYKQRFPVEDSYGIRFKVYERRK